MAGSVELEEEAIWLSIFFGPKQGIDHRDISDLIGGAIALLKLQIDADLGSDSGDNLDGNRVFLDFLDRIKVSEQGSFSRVQISITSNDMDTLWDSIRSVLSALDLPS